jgi:hypothetical protein
MSTPPIVPQVNVKDGSGAGGLGKSDNFEWIYPSPPVGPNPAQLSGCGGFCTQDSFVVWMGGSTPAQIRSDSEPGSHPFTDSAWDAPGQPHITIGSTSPKHHEQDKKEVA